MINLLDLFTRHTLQYFLRIAIIICGYIVVRPLIEAFFRRVMTPQDTVDRPERRGPRQKSLADELLVDTDTAEDELAEDGHDSFHQNSTGAAEWGGTIRKRQKARFMEAWELEQARLGEEEELRELEDILED